MKIEVSLLNESDMESNDGVNLHLGFLNYDGAEFSRIQEDYRVKTIEEAKKIVKERRTFLCKLGFITHYATLVLNDKIYEVLDLIVSDYYDGK